MKKQVLTKCAVCLLAAVMCLQTVTRAHAVSARPGDAATEANVLEVLRQYDAGAYHIMKTEADSGYNFMRWFTRGSLISRIDTAVHETFHSYTYNQNSGVLQENIYLGGGKSYDVDYSIVYRGGFTKTEEMARQLPPQLRTFRYDTYVAPGVTASANTHGVYGLLNEFTAYCWGLETMNSLVPFLTDTGAGADAWTHYVTSIGNNITAYAEFKYWTLRYMLYIKSANPALYQAILDDKTYCGAYRDAETKFASEIARSRALVDGSAEYLRSKGCVFIWSDTEIALRRGSTASGLGLEDYRVLMAELETAQYLEMDSILKHTTVSAPAVVFTDVPAWCSSAVDWAVDEGITNGVGNSKFAPNDICKNTEILTMLWRANGKPPSAASPLTAPSSYQAAVDWAYAEGLISDSFVPGAHCTRAAALKYIWQVFGSVSVKGGGFTDVPADADYAAAVSWAVANGVTNGYPGNTFRPGGTCTRGEIVTFLHRAYVKDARLTVTGWIPKAAPAGAAFFAPLLESPCISPRNGIKLK